MSDYVREKVLRVPFDKYFKNTEFKDPYALEYSEKFKHLFCKQDYPKFSAACTDNDNFIDLVLYHTYGEECGDFGFARLLSLEEQAKFESIFKELIPNIDMNDVHYVDYCYYNCCEAPDYYEIKSPFDVKL